MSRKFRLWNGDCGATIFTLNANGSHVINKGSIPGMIKLERVADSTVCGKEVGDWQLIDS